MAGNIWRFKGVCGREWTDLLVHLSRTENHPRVDSGVLRARQLCFQETNVDVHVYGDKTGG